MGALFVFWEAQSMGVPLLSAPSGDISTCIRNQDHKARQAIRIKELGAALAADGFVTVDEQAKALGLSRSTAWAVLKANHKASGLAAGTINQMLSSPALPPRAIAVIRCSQAMSSWLLSPGSSSGWFTSGATRIRP
jgi:hypothetical protein